MSLWRTKKGNNMIRVLHINAGSGIFGGVSAFCLNIYRNIDRDKVQFDFLTPDKTTYGQYREEITRYGGNVYEFGIGVRSSSGKIKFTKRLKEFLKDHPYDIIHINSGILSFNYIVANACKMYSNSKVFVHSHSNGGRSKAREMLSGILKQLLVKRADCLLACSVSSAEYVFPLKAVSKTEIIDNGIDTQRFRYDPAVRESMRNLLQLNGKYVIGHVGSFTIQKNHEYLIEIFSKVKEKNADSILLLVGEGPLLTHIQEMSEAKGLADSVKFLGARKDVSDFYQAMDVFVLPSVFEGFGIVNIEAQTAGLKCVTSTVVPKNVDVTGNVVQVSLDASIDLWVKEILNKSVERRDYSNVVKEQGFDIKTSSDKLTLLYEEALRK